MQAVDLAHIQPPNGMGLACLDKAKATRRGEIVRHGSLWSASNSCGSSSIAWRALHLLPESEANWLANFGESQRWRFNHCRPFQDLGLSDFVPFAASLNSVLSLRPLCGRINSTSGRWTISPPSIFFSEYVSTFPFPTAHLWGSPPCAGVPVATARGLVKWLAALVPPPGAKEARDSSWARGRDMKPSVFAVQCKEAPWMPTSLGGRKPAEVGAHRHTLRCTLNDAHLGLTFAKISSSTVSL